MAGWVDDANAGADPTTITRPLTADQIAAARFKADRLATVTLVEPCNTVARLSGMFWRSGVLLLLPGAGRMRRIVEMLCGKTAPASRVAR
ncbi:hypothetical protein A5722_17000 [Mycobacterium vulneris]|nr:hypothetical protein A5722_17000 [Mycolicibacterium vulneris]OCB65580.1 hypothetical protein A5729_15835 [Mycolicibacterium vulneris]